MKNILILCTGNSCRSQMAHGYLKQMLDGKAEVYSAGIETHGLNAGAVAAMRDDGLDISSHTSNHVNEYRHIAFDFIITVCDHARENCPYLPGVAIRVHTNFPDPSKAVGDELFVKEQFAAARDQIKAFCVGFCKEYF